MLKRVSCLPKAGLGYACYGVKDVVAKELVHAAVKVVGAGAGDHVDDATGGIAELRWNNAGHNIEFLHRIGLEIDGDLSQPVLQIAYAIENVVVDARARHRLCGSPTRRFHDSEILR